MELKLGYNDFQTNASETFLKLWNGPYYSDVTLTTADDRHVGAHKIALCYNDAFVCNHCDYTTARQDYPTTHKKITQKGVNW